VVLLSGGVGITVSANDSCIFYYCRIRLRIRIDMGNSTEMLNLIQMDQQDPYERQLDMFAQASNLLRTRSPGEFVCNMRFNQLHHLEAFWNDYLNGFLKQMLMDNLLSPSSRSLVGRHEFPAPVTVSPDSIPTAASMRWGDRGSTSTSASRSNGANREYLPPSDALTAALRALRIRVNASGYGSGAGGGRSGTAGPGRTTSGPISPDFDIHLFISRREYENGRALLMRNLRTIPSLCRLVAASNFLPAIAASQNAAGTNTTAPSVPPPAYAPPNLPTTSGSGPLL